MSSTNTIVTDYFSNLFVPVCPPSIAITAPYGPEFIINCATVLPLAALILVFVIFSFACEACESVTEHPAAGVCSKMPPTQSSKRHSDSNDLISQPSKIPRLTQSSRVKSFRSKSKPDLRGDQFIVLNINENNFPAAQSSEPPELALVIYEQCTRISFNQLIVYECPHIKMHDYMRYVEYQRMKKLFNGFEHLKSRKYYTKRLYDMKPMNRSEHELVSAQKCDEEIILTRINDKKPSKPIRGQFVLNIKNLNNKH